MIYLTKNVELLFAVRRLNALLRRRQNGEEPTMFRKGYGYALELLDSENGLSQQQLADRMNIRPQTVSEMLCGLEKSGWIAKLPCAQDKRSVEIFITEEGIKARNCLRELRAAKADACFGILSEEEKDSLLAVLKKLSDNYERGNV